MHGNSGRVAKFIIGRRILVLTVSGLILFRLISTGRLSLWYVLLGGILLGVVFGKVFCRWVCPMGLVMELLMSLSGSQKARQMYQYHKVGCPIAWISGFLNRFSLFRIRLAPETCLKCGKCDSSCYIVEMTGGKYSLFKPECVRPGTSFTCSKCLACVAVCPNGSLKYGIWPGTRPAA